MPIENRLISGIKILVKDYNMTNQEMAKLIKNMVGLVEANNYLQRDDIFDRLNKVIQKLENDQELNIDDKQSLNDLMYSLYIDSTVMWDLVV